MRHTSTIHIRPLKAQAPYLVRKTIRCGIVHLTKIKREILNQEFDNLQHFLQTGNDLGVHSANKQQAKWFYKTIKSNKEYPVSIRKDLLRIVQRNTKLAKFWGRIPVKGRRGGVWVAIKPHCEFPVEYEVCESKLLRTKSRFFLHLTIKKKVQPILILNPSKLAVIACDIGEANPIASVAWWDKEVQEVKFHATEVWAIRAHYAHLRKQIGKKKVKHALRIIKKIGNKEQRKVRDLLHKATRQVIQQASELRQNGFEPVIVVGDLKNHRIPRRKGTPRCRKNNRKIHSMPSYQVKTQLEYKALWESVPVLYMNEAYTSQICHRCGNKGLRTKRQFKCSCGIDYNADLNGTRNILTRSLGYILRDRAAVNPPRSPTANRVSDRTQWAMGEAPSLGKE
ncbi:MAG: RNA-guided endonuclease InsQ/TnpB family protein [Candidatus Heimdallarchaeota archaeon]